MPEWSTPDAYIQRARAVLVDAQSMHAEGQCTMCDQHWHEVSKLFALAAIAEERQEYDPAGCHCGCGETYTPGNSPSAPRAWPDRFDDTGNLNIVRGEQ